MHLYTCTYTHAPTHMHLTHAHAPTHIHLTQIYLHTYTYTHTPHTHIPTHIYLTHAPTHMHLHTHIPHTCTCSQPKLAMARQRSYDPFEAVAMFDFAGDMLDEEVLSLRQGEKVTVLEDTGDWWKARDQHG